MVFSWLHKFHPMAPCNVQMVVPEGWGGPTRPGASADCAGPLMAVRPERGAL
jgi:hypothetical protein